MRFRYLVSICVFASLLVAGCASVPVSTMWKLRDFDIVKTDAAKLRVGIRIPEFMQVEPDGATLEITMWNGDQSVRNKEVLVLQVVVEQSELNELARFHKSGFAIHVYKLSDRSLKKLVRFKQQYAALKEEFGDDVQGSLSVGAKGCLLPQAEKQAALMTTFLKSSETGSFVVLTSETDVGKIAGAKGVKRCGDGS